MSKPLATCKTSREMIRIRKVTISSNKLKKSPQLSKITQSSNPSTKNSFVNTEKPKSAMYNVQSKRENLFDIQNEDYDEEDSVIMTLNELLTPSTKKNHQNLEEVKCSSMRFLNFKTQRDQTSRNEPVKLFERIKHRE